jgi:hypothetical protein
VLDLDLKVATAGVGLDQEWVGTQSGSRKGPGDAGGRTGAVACMAETVWYRVSGHGVRLDEVDGGRRKERLREWQSFRIR